MRASSLALGGLIALAGAPAHADLADWEVNEVVASVGGNPAIRFVELTNAAGGCLFPTSRVEVRDGEGALVASAPLVTSTTCYEPGRYLLLATPGAVAHFGIAADRGLIAPLDATTAQVCFASSGTAYDCVRWGAVAAPVTDFFAADDLTLAPLPTDGVALARVQTTHVIADDWAQQSPTPRGPNDGTPWSPPDAGPVPDAGPSPDAAAAPDAAPRPDAASPVDAAPRPDARDDTYLDIEPVGGAACDCRVGRRGRGAATSLALLAFAALATGCVRRTRSR